MRFPKVEGQNLLKEKKILPSDLSGDLNIVIIAFQRWHQGLVNTWVPFLDSLIQKKTNLNYYELPTIREMNPLFRRFIDGGMRSGIPSEDTRRRTITLYIEKEPFRKSLEIPDEENIHIYLIDQSGKVYWREEGEVSKEKASSLEEVLENM
ncbi:MAG: hypothetical protein BAJATHORv1_30267 [Candidatus Thorarchaeota archaeon]|nr:MAG: hypothetical protein BAJATHORv1_30267 [Candidatus Thorarchaeota archaeon]